jgi:hypothetical protein
MPKQAKSAEPPLTNPAGRLWHVAKEIKGYGSITFSEGTARLFRCSVADKRQLLLGAQCFFSLIREVELAVRAVESINPDLHLTWVEKVNLSFNEFSLNPSYGNIQSVGNAFDANAMSLILICSDHIERIGAREPSVDDGEIAALLEQVLAVLAEVEVADIALPAKLYMLRHLQMVADALFEYRFAGYSGLWHGFGCCAGTHCAAVARADYVHPQVASPELWEKTLQILSRFSAIVTSARNIEFVLEKCERLVKLLPGSAQ